MFIVCWCKYDIKNPAKRHPDRVEFERLLKLSSQQYYEKADFSKSPDKSMQVSTASTTIMQQNERSVKSIDEVMDFKEVEDELKEVKHPNGQICYIEDNKSHKSQSSLNKKDEELGSNDTSEEEKSVIAMLDDVLQTEDDNLNDSQLMPNYDRKFSIDSELVPSVIRSTTVATVHSSSSNSSENEFYTLKKDSLAKSIDSGIESYQAKQKVAQDLVNEVLNSPELWMALEKYQQDKENQINNEYKSKQDSFNSNNDSLFNSDYETKYEDLIGAENSSVCSENHHKSLESLNSLKSVEDPLHSENFRNKLSLLILKPPEPPKTHKEQSKPEESSAEDRPKLKHSKSEADVRQLVLKAIEGCNIDLDDKNIANETANGNERNIPKPPKFDPILYKTINSLSRPKERPSLDKLMKKEEFLKPQIIEEPVEAHNELPFKQKLEAILKRGPSHRTQQKPEVEQRRPKSVEPLQLAESNEDLTNQRINFTKSESNLQEPHNVIEATRKALRPVKTQPIEL